jgi:EXPERA (EXPanded EBP superfamily)
MWLEALYHLPVSVWAIGALYRGKLESSQRHCQQFLGDPKVPLQLFLFAAETAITTMTCISDYLSWSSFSNEQKLQLGYLYVPYLVLCKYSAMA